MPAATVREKPCLFAGPMVNAIQSGRKTVTRRLIKHHLPTGPCDIRDIGNGPEIYGAGGVWLKLRLPYAVGDVLYVREAWKPDVDGDISCVTFQADGAKVHIENTRLAADKWLEVRKSREQWPDLESPVWRPSIHMPKWAARLWLEVTAVKVERLQEGFASPKGCTIARDEGIVVNCPEHNMGSVCCCMENCKRHIDAFRELWDSLNKPGFQWADNPWVSVTEFRRIKRRDAGCQ